MVSNFGRRKRLLFEGTHGRSSHFSRAGRNALLALSSIIISICVSVVAIELCGDYQYRQWKHEYSQRYSDGLTKLTIASPNETLLWEYRPNALIHPPGGVEIRTNRYGFRDVDLQSPDKPDGVYRVAFVGDSVTVASMRPSKTPLFESVPLTIMSITSSATKRPYSRKSPT
jgi:hypothetical protein